MGNAPHVPAPWLEVVIGPRATHGFARQALVISELDRRVGQRRLRPAGGLAHAVATSRAFSLPVSLRSAPGRGPSLKARSRLPSTKRRLVRPTVERLTRTVRTISASQRPHRPPAISAPASACGRRACRRRASPSVHRARLGSIRPDNVHSCFASLSEAGMNPMMSQKSGALHRASKSSCRSKACRSSNDSVSKRQNHVEPLVHDRDISRRGLAG